ncbi:MAG: flagellar hook-basal body complex protein FliE [Paracoccaceae bacterium]
MDVRTSFATQGYAQARSAAAPKPQADGSEQTGFAKVAQSFAQTLQAGEETAKAAMVGGADPHALVQALAQTELAVETAVTVRNKVVEAYQEILRMQV